MEAPKNTLGATIRQNLLLGLLTSAPLLLTLWVLVAVVRYLDQAIYAILPWDFYIPGLGMAVAFVLILCAGFLARTYMGRMMNQIVDAMFAKVPVVRGLYSSVKQISGTFFSQDATKTFKRVVMVPFPHPGSRTLGFVSAHWTEKESLVFVPTAPNPTSGYVLAFRNEEIEDAHMEVDEALRVIVSCGFLPKGPPKKA